MAVSKKPMLLDGVWQRIRLKHYSHRTKKSYVHWIRCFVRFHSRRSLCDTGKVEIEAFLTHLAVDRKISASTQNQAFNALLFLYLEFLSLKVLQLGTVSRPLILILPPIRTTPKNSMQCDHAKSD